MLNTNNHFLIHSLYSILSKLISRKSDRQTASRMRPENYHKRRHGFQRGFILPNYSIFIRYRLHKNKRLSLYIYIYISPSRVIDDEHRRTRRKFSPLLYQLYSHLQQFFHPRNCDESSPNQLRRDGSRNSRRGKFIERNRFPRTRFSRTLVYFDPSSSRAKRDPISS